MDRTITSLKSDGKLTKTTLTKCVLLFALIFGMQGANAQGVFIANNAGNWNVAGTWTLSSGTDADGIPDSDDSVTIDGNNDVTVTANAACTSLTVNGNTNNQTTFLLVNTGVTLSVGGAFAISGSNGQRKAELIVDGIIQFASTTSFAAASSNMIYTIGSGCTFEYNGTAQTIPIIPGPISYSNLILSGSGTKTSAASFAVTGTMTVNSGVTFTPGATTHVFSGAGTITGTGTIRTTLVSATALTTQYTITNKTLTGLTVDFAAAGNQSIASTATVGNYGGLTTSGGSGTKTLLGATTVNGNVDIGTGTTLTVSGSNFAINVGGNWSRTGTFTQGTGTVTFNGNGATQVISGSATTFSTLTVATGAKVRNDVASVITTFNVNGTGYFIHNVVGALPGTTRTFSNTGAPNTQSTIEFQNNTVNTAPVAASYGNLIINISSYSASVGASANLTSIGGDLRIQNTGGQELRLVSTQSTTHAIGGNLSIEGPNAKLVINSTTGSPNVNVAGNLNISDGTFDIGLSTGTPVVNVTGGVNLSGGILKRTGSAVTLNLAGNWSNTGGTFTSANITVNFNGTAQSIGGTSSTTFNNLTLSGSGTKTFGIATAVSSALSIGSGVVANLGGFIHTSAILSLNGSAQGTGSSYGGTGSVAATINTTFFAAALGAVNVGTCGTYSLLTTGNTSICPGNTTSVAVTASGANLPIGSYVVFYTLTGANTGTSSSSMTVSVAGVGSFATLTLANAGATTITIDYIRNGCVSKTILNNTATITVNSPSTAAVISGTATICSGSNGNLQVAITGGLSPYTVVYSAGSVGSYTSGSNIAVTPASTTAYTLTSVTDANGCAGSGNSGSAVLTIDSTTSVNGGPWSNGVPAAGKSVIFDGTTITLGSTLTACSLTLKNNSVVTIQSGSSVILTGALDVDLSSTFTLDNNANLIQGNSNYTNTGNIIVKRNSSALKRFDYTLWSSPVTGQGVYAFSPFTFANRFYVYNTSTNLFNNPSVGLNVTGLNPDGVNGTDSNNVQFASAKGYLIRIPWDHPTAATIWNGTFTGVPRNGNINYTMTNGGSGLRFNLVGNPYPSPINMTTFVSDNSSNITGTLYFWRDSNNSTVDNAYCTWAGGTFTSNNQAQAFNPSGVIRTGQGFIVEASGASTTLSFKNGQRTAENANQFFRTNTLSTDSVETNRIWLNLSNTAEAFCQMAVGYMTDATDAVDMYDGKNINTGNVLLSSILDNTDYTIQGKSLPFNAADVVPLSCKITDAGNYTIALDHVDGIFTGGAQSVYLKDNLTTTIHDLNSGAYTFTSAAGTFTNRFEIVYQNQLGVDNPAFTANNVIVYSQNNGFVVNSGSIIMSSIKVFDIRGRLIEERKAVNASQTTINGGLANEVLLVQITSEDGVIVTKKVIR